MARYSFLFEPTVVHLVTFCKRCRPQFEDPLVIWLQEGGSMASLGGIYLKGYRSGVVDVS